VIAIIPERVIGMPRNTDRHRPESPKTAPPKNYDKQGTVFAVPTHYDSTFTINSGSRSYSYACDSDSGNVSCTDSPITFFPYVRLIEGGPRYFAAPFWDAVVCRSDSPDILSTILEQQDVEGRIHQLEIPFIYRVYENPPPNKMIIAVPYGYKDRKKKVYKYETCYELRSDYISPPSSKSPSKP
jgi:hypothetical protein